MRAGTEMLQKGEEILMYLDIQHFLEKKLYGAALDTANTYDADYCFLPEVPMEFITLNEIKAIKKEELRSLPWIYVHMLETLCSKDAETEMAINTLIKESSLSKWYTPMIEGITHKHSFSYNYTKWHYDNQWTEGFNNWAGRFITYETERSNKRMRCQ